MSTRFEKQPTVDFQDQIPKRVLPRIVMRQVVFNENKEATRSILTKISQQDSPERFECKFEQNLAEAGSPFVHAREYRGRNHGTCC